MGLGFGVRGLGLLERDVVVEEGRFLFLFIRCVLGDIRLWVGDPSTSCLLFRLLTPKGLLDGDVVEVGTQHLGSVGNATCSRCCSLCKRERARSQGGMQLHIKTQIYSEPRRDQGQGRPASVFRVSGSGFRVPGVGFRVPAFGLRVPGFGFRVPGFGIRDPDFECRMPDSGFRVLGFGSRGLSYERGGTASII